MLRRQLDTFIRDRAYLFRCKIVTKTEKKLFQIYAKFNSIIPGQYHNVGQPPQNPQHPDEPAPSTERPVKNGDKFGLDNRFGEPVWDIEDVPQVNLNTITNPGGKGKN